MDIFMKDLETVLVWNAGRGTSPSSVDIGIQEINKWVMEFIDQQGMQSDPSDGYRRAVSRITAKPWRTKSNPGTIRFDE